MTPSKPVASFREWTLKRIGEKVEANYGLFSWFVGPEEEIRVIEYEAVEDAYDRGILEGSRIGDACAAAARKERDQDMERLQGERVSIYKSNELLTQRNQELESLLEAVRIANDLHNLGDAVYDVRSRADMDNHEGSSWEHPDVVKYSAAVDIINKALSMDREK